MRSFEIPLISPFPSFCLRSKAEKGPVLYNFNPEPKGNRFGSLVGNPTYQDLTQLRSLQSLRAVDSCPLVVTNQVTKEAGMRRISVFVTIAFLAGLAIGFFTRSAYTGMLQRRTHAADLAAIEKLHREDIEVTLSQDPKGLVDVWGEDGVRFNPGSPPAVGKQAIEAENEKLRAQYPDFKVLKYAPDTGRLPSECAR